jgi:hypothetical protein
MPNITRGDRMPGLVMYLVGPGRQDEHVNPHLVAGSPSLMAWWGDQVLTEADAVAIAKELDQPHVVYGVDPYGGHVWHLSLAVKREEGELGDQKWGDIATAVMERMDFLVEGKAPVRWGAFHHGPTVEREDGGGGNDHIHVVVDIVREDGTKASTWNDRPKMQAICRQLEQEFGLAVVESRGIGMGERGRLPRDVPRPARRGGKRPAGPAETPAERLERIVRGTAAGAVSEAEFVRGLRAAGLLARPRWRDGGQQGVVGYSVAFRPPRGERPLWFGGGRLARDLTLPRLRDTHWATGLADPVRGAQEATEAVGEWRAAWRNKRSPGQPRHERPTRPPMDPQTWARYATEVAELREQLRAVPAGDVATWSAVAHQLAGAFSAWSLAAEGDTAGPLAATAATLARTAQVRRGWDDEFAQVRSAWGPSVRGWSLILASAARGGQGPVGMAVLLRQLANLAKAVHDAHRAAGRAQEAERIRAVVLGDLEQVRQALPSADLRAAAVGPVAQVDPQIGAGQVVGGGRLQAPGSPVPAHLAPHRTIEHTGGHDHGR